MRLCSTSLLVVGAATLAAATAMAQTADIEGYVFGKRNGAPIAGAVVVVYENVTAGPIPILLAEDVTDGNGFYQVRIPTPTFPIGVVEVFCRTPRGVVLRGISSAPLEDDVIRQRNIYLGSRLLNCLDAEPGDVPPFIRP